MTRSIATMVVVIAVASLALPGRAHAVIVGSLSAQYDYTVRGGGVVAAGASLAGREDGVANATAAITVSGIPAGSTVHQALLYWTISGGADTTATVNAAGVTGVQRAAVGDACWVVTNSTFRADVTAWVTGNGVYTIGGLPSSTVAAAADTDGVALVVVYKNPASALVRRVMIRDGGISTNSGGEVVSDTFSGLSPPSPTPARFHLVVGDGQGGSTDGNVTFAGIVVGTNQFSGSSGSLWDVRSYNVSIPAALANAIWIHNTVADCLVFQAAVLDYDIPQSADLAVTKTDGVTVAVPGSQVTYTIVVSNNGPHEAPGATLTDTFPAACASVSTTSVASGGAAGNTAGPFAGNIGQTLFLPTGSSVTYTSTCNIAANATGTLSNDATVSSGVTDPNPGNNAANDTDALAVTLDIDASGTGSRYDALTDGILAIRYMFLLSGPALTANALGDTASRTLPGDIETYMNDAGLEFDIDDNGVVDALTDGLMILRYLFNISGPALINNAIGDGANRITAGDIETYLQGLTPP